MRTPGHSSHEDINDNALARQYILNRPKVITGIGNKYNSTIIFNEYGRVGSNGGCQRVVGNFLLKQKEQKLACINLLIIPHGKQIYF
jgi:hypothetical protein